jgi:hypothetical protein
MAKPQQRILTLAFLRPSPDDHWVNRLAARASKHPICHAELYFESLQQSFSIMWGETANFRTRNLSNPNYTLVSLSVSSKEYDACLEFCRSTSTLNLTFDDRGMWTSWLSPVVGCSVCDATSQQKGHTFCSKIITEALQFGGLREVEALRPSAVTPSRLYECVRHSGRVACNSVPFKRQALTMLSAPLGQNG